MVLKNSIVLDPTTSILIKIGNLIATDQSQFATKSYYTECLGNNIVQDNSDIAPLEKSLPQVTSNTVISSNQIKLTFNDTLDSESAADLRHYRLRLLANDKDLLNIYDVTVNATERSVILWTDTLATGRIYSLDVDHLISNQAKQSFNLASSHSLNQSLYISEMKRLSDTKFILVLNTPVQNLDLNNCQFLFGYQPQPLSKVTLSDDGTNVEIITDSSIPKIESKALTVCLSGLIAIDEDLANSGRLYIQISSAAFDVIAPTLLKVESLSNTTVRITFSEDIQPILDTISAHFRIEGLNILSAFGSNNYVQLATESQKSQNYGLSIDNISDLSGNILKSVSVNFMGLEKPALVLKPTAAFALNNRQIKIYFDRAFDPSSGEQGALNPNIYQIYNASFSNPATGELPEGTLLQADAEAVYITFPSNIAIESNKIIQLEVGPIKGLDGILPNNVSTSLQVAVNLSPPSPLIVSGALLEGQSLTIHFSSDITGIINEDHFEIYQQSADIQENITDEKLISKGVLNTAVIHNDSLTLTLDKPLDSNIVYYLNIRDEHGVKSLIGHFDLEINPASGKEEAIFVSPFIAAVD